MPNLTSHVALALTIANELEPSVITQNLGSYLLGATSPDIRIITQQSREITHYSPLDSSIIGDGVAKLLEENPDLSDETKSSPATQAFVCGYITHLISDQTWIVTMYKPYFGNRLVFPNETLANIWDRALQLEMDRQDRSAWENASPYLKVATKGVTLNFISSTDLTKWAEWVGEYALGEFSWDRLRSLARRQPIEDESIVQEAAESFLADIPNGLQQIIASLGNDDLDSYRARAVQGSQQSINTFLES